MEKKRILVVDDRPSNTRLIKLSLEQTDGFEVREENNALAAVAAAEAFRPHLILMDVMMPGMSGGELASCMEANPLLRGVPIVFLTAAITKAEIAANGALRGGYPFLAKPVVLTELVACIDKLLGDSTPPQSRR